MRDERLRKLARLLVEYSIGAREREQVLLSGGVAAEPLIREVYTSLLEAGAVPFVHAALPGLQERFFEHARELHYRKTPPMVRSLYEQADAFVNILAPTNTRALAGVDPSKQQALSRRDKELSDMVLKRDRWVLTLFPTDALAQESEMGLEEYEDFVFAAMALGEQDPVSFWREKSRRQERLKERLERAREIRITGPDTDLTLSVEGRTFINSAGTHNMPCGEVFTGPVEDSANGHIYFGIPVAVAGREVSGVRLRFENGRVVEASAEKGEEYLRSMLEADEGARYLGELGIGTNYHIPRPTRNILFDEKLGGTVHLALGRSYESTGGRNSSSIHWDLICDLRGGGEIRADGETIQKDGRFVGLELG
ncbi:Peptidase M29, aminopeptidase 2 [Rubrobacter xylanophilus DSM 9941]|uniref:aminopeptidase n=1 Tax=Rubrobacter xylanophilus TaxID=49319 RepID=UPI001C63F033|nr:aminopeptidase [Rubrobacter xylanophilus]QYJ14408.1 Peptidase M29, aminopeptidase 2 [Rubrobacter xylanophilus DSM 9941]